MSEKVEWARAQLSHRWKGVKSKAKKKSIAISVWKEARKKFNN